MLIVESLMKPIEPHWAGPLIGRDFIGLAYCNRELEFTAGWIDGKESAAGNDGWLGHVNVPLIPSSSASALLSRRSRRRAQAPPTEPQSVRPAPQPSIPRMRSAKSWQIIQ